MGVPIDGPTNVFCLNELVVKSVFNSEVMLKRKQVIPVPYDNNSTRSTTVLISILHLLQDQTTR